MKKLNIPLLLFLIVGFIASAIGIRWLHGYQVGKSVDGLLARAGAAKEKGDVEEQIRLLRRYLRYEREDFDTKTELFRIVREQAMEDGNILTLLRNFTVLENSLMEAGDHEGMRREAYISANTMGRWADAEDHLRQLPEESLTAKDHVNWAVIMWRKGDGPEAEKKLCKLIGFDMESLNFDGQEAEAPTEVDAYTALAMIYMRDRTEHDDATIPMRILDKSIELNPDSADAYLKRAGFRREHFKDGSGREESLADVRRALELEPNELGVIAVAARTAFSENDFTWAEEILARGKELHPDNPYIYRLMATSSRQQNKLEEAIERLNAGLEKAPSNAELLSQRAELELDAGQLDAARQTIKRLSEKRSFNGIRLQYLKARGLIAEQNFMPASKILEKLVPAIPEGNSLRSQIERRLANCYRAMNMTDKLQELSLNQDSAQGRFEQARNLMSQARYEEAARLYRELMSEESVTDDGRRLVMRQLLSALIQAERAKPVARRNWTQVDKIAAGFMPKQENPIVREALEIDLLVQKGMEREALNRVEAAISRYPREASFRMTFAKLTPDYQQAMDLLDRLQESMRNSMEVRLAQVNRVMSKQDPEETKARIGSYVAELGLYEAEDKRTLLTSMATAYRHVGLRDEALALAKQRVTDGDNSIRALLGYFDMAVEAKQDEMINDAQERIAQLATKDSAEWRICEARRRVEKIKAGEGDDLDPSHIMTLVEAARQERPNFAPIYAIRADVLLLQNKDEEAIESLRTALQFRPGEPTYLSALYSTLKDNNRIAEANAVVAQMPGYQSGSAQAVMAEVSQLLQTNPNAAVAKAEETFSPDSDDPNVLQNLANVYMAAKQHEKAVRVLQRGVSVDPGNRRMWLQLVRSLMSAGQQEKAKSVVPKAGERIPESERYLAMGQMYSECGDLPNALAMYDKGLDRNPNDTLILVNKARIHQFSKENDEYTATLDRILKINPSNEIDKASVEQARRMKAQQLHSTGSYSEFENAIALLELNRNERGKLFGEDLLLWLQICASRPEASSRRKATDLLSQLRSERDLTVTESVIFAELRYQDGNWKDAESMMLDIMAKTNNPAYTIKYISWLVERRDTSSAARYMANSGLDVEAPQVLPYAMMILAQQNRSKDAYTRLQKLVPKKLNNGQAAIILEQVAKYDPRFFTAAKKHWDLFMKTNPNQISNYIEFLARMPDAAGVESALSLAEKELGQAIKDKKTSVAQYYVSLGLRALRSNRTSIPKNSPYYSRVYKWLSLVKQAGVDDLNATWNQFEFFDIRQDYDQLKTLYSKFLDRTDTTEMQRAVVRNNLAFLYALSNDGTRALSTIGDAINELGPRPDFLDTRGLAYLVNGQINEAIEDLKQAADGNPDSGVLFHLALALYKGQQFEEAAKNLDQSLELGLDPDALSSPERQLFDTLYEAVKAQMTVPVGQP